MRYNPNVSFFRSELPDGEVGRGKLRHRSALIIPLLRFSLNSTESMTGVIFFVTQTSVSDSVYVVQRRIIREILPLRVTVETPQQIERTERSFRHAHPSLVFRNTSHAHGLLTCDPFRIVRSAWLHQQCVHREKRTPPKDRITERFVVIRPLSLRPNV